MAGTKRLRVVYSSSSSSLSSPYESRGEDEEEEEEDDKSRLGILRVEELESDARRDSASKTGQ